MDYKNEAHDEEVVKVTIVFLHNVTMLYCYHQDL